MCGAGGSDNRVIKSYKAVEGYLNEFKRRVKNGQFKVSERDKNTVFVRTFNLVSTKRQQKILLDLCIEDYVYALPSKMEGNEGQHLYVFIRKFPLAKPRSALEEVLVYIKVDMIAGEDQVAIVVSFHEADRDEDHPYR